MPTQEKERENYITTSGIFDVIDRLGNKVLGDEWRFYSEIDLYNKPEYINPTAISYKINHRTHNEQTARKPMHKDIEEEDGKKFLVQGQMFDIILCFGIWGKNYTQINNTREWFEGFLFENLDELKKEGVLKLLFDEQLEDDIVTINNNYYAVQKVKYYFRNSVLKRTPQDIISDININFNGFTDSQRAQNFYENN